MRPSTSVRKRFEDAKVYTLARVRQEAHQFAPEAEVGKGDRTQLAMSLQSAAPRGEDVIDENLQTMESLVRFVEDYFKLPEALRVTLSNMATQPKEFDLPQVLDSLAAFLSTWSGVLSDPSTEEGQLILAAIRRPGEANRVAAEIAPELAEMRAALESVAQQVSERPGGAPSSSGALLACLKLDVRSPQREPLHFIGGSRRPGKLCPRPSPVRRLSPQNLRRCTGDQCVTATELVLSA